jgi:uncharacterized protein YjbI with pentapeptide repeats
VEKEAMSQNSLLAAIRANDASAIAGLREEGETSLDGETFKDLHLSDMDLSGFDLSNTEWDSCMLDSVSFKGAIMEGAYLTGSTLMDCVFDEADLEGASLEGCVLLRSSFKSAKLDASEIEGTELTDCTIEAVVLRDVEWQTTTFNNSHFVDVKGESGDLSNIVLRGGEVAGLDTSGLTIQNCSTSQGSNPPAGFSLLSGRRKRLS